MSVAVLHYALVCTGRGHCWARDSAVCRCGQVLRGGRIWLAPLQLADDEEIAAMAADVVRR